MNEFRKFKRSSNYIKNYLSLNNGILVYCRLLSCIPAIIIVAVGLQNEMFPFPNNKSVSQIITVGSIKIFDQNTNPKIP
jgi:hypothetical protein